MRQSYSRLTRIEERRNLKKAIFYILATITLIIVFVILGLPTIAKLAGFLTNIRNSNLPVEKNDITPPAPPQIEAPLEYTNRDRVEIKGTAEAGATVIINANNSKNEVIATKDGLFSYTFSLRKGENTISATAKDTAGNESQPSDIYIVTLDNEPPTVEVTSPQDGENFYGSRQRQILIEGKTSDAASLTINGRIIILENDGTFAYAVSLQEGDNNFEITAKDLAGNEATSRLTVHYWR
jgi:hypothetical protein